MHFVHSGCQDANLALVQYSGFWSHWTPLSCHQPQNPVTSALLVGTRWGRLRVKSFQLLAILGGKSEVKAEVALIHCQSTPRAPNIVGHTQFSWSGLRRHFFRGSLS